MSIDPAKQVSLAELQKAEKELQEVLFELEKEVISSKVEVTELRKTRGYKKANLTHARKKRQSERAKTLEAEIQAMSTALAPKEATLASLESRYKEHQDQVKTLQKAIRRAQKKIDPNDLKPGNYDTYAQALADTLQSELTLLDEDILIKKRAGEKEWHAFLPPRSELGSFSCVDRVKERLGIDDSVDFSSDVPLGFSPDDADTPEPDTKLFHWFFCMVHCGFEPRSATDMDHADPFEHVRENQQRLLDLLNSKPDFARELIKQHEMNLYFKVEDGRVMVSDYFLLKRLQRYQQPLVTVPCLQPK